METAKIIPIQEQSKAQKHIAQIKDGLVERALSPNTQLIRLGGDVLFIAPVLIYAGWRKSDMPTWLRLTIAGIGVATLYYNLKNFIEVEKEILALKKLNEEAKIVQLKEAKA